MTKSHTKLEYSTSCQIVWMRRLAVLQTSDKLRCLQARWYLSYKFLILLNELRLYGAKKFLCSAFFPEAKLLMSWSSETSSFKGKLAFRRANKINAFRFLCLDKFIFQKVCQRSSNKVSCQKSAYLCSSRRLNSFKIAGGVRGASPGGGM